MTSFKDSFQSMVFVSCPACKRRALKTKWENNYYVCPLCGHYHSMSAIDRLSAVFDSGSIHEMDRRIQASDPLAFPDYQEKLIQQKKKTGLKEAAVTATGRIGGIPAVR